MVIGADGGAEDGGGDAVEVSQGNPFPMGVVRRSGNVQREGLHVGLAVGSETVWGGEQVQVDVAISGAGRATLAPDHGDAQAPAPSGVSGKQFLAITAGGVEVAVLACVIQAPALAAGELGFGMDVLSGHCKSIGCLGDNL